VADVSPQSRRGFLKIAFWSSIGFAAVAAGAAMIRFFYPQDDEDSQRFLISESDVPEAGAAPLSHTAGKFFLVNLARGEGETERSTASRGGLLALSWRCPHLHCSVRFPDLPEYSGGAGNPDGFGCPCHGARFTKAGVRTFGPAAHGLDTARCIVSLTGAVTVDMSRLETGGDDNPSRAVAYDRRGSL
jgi:Rieske Fe-S protein